jgi:hypothetical protein
MITITIDTDNDAFSSDYEVSRILFELAETFEGGFKHLNDQSIKDINGNTVGQVTIEEPEMDCLHSFDDDDPMAICKTCGVIRTTVRRK